MPMPFKCSFHMISFAKKQRVAWRLAFAVFQWVQSTLFVISYFGIRHLRAKLQCWSLAAPPTRQIRGAHLEALTRSVTLTEIRCNFIHNLVICPGLF